METAKYVMEAKGISRTYKGEVPVYALKETDLAFTEGEFAAIVGREDGSGYGIGLALAKEVVARHSGRLTVIRPAAGTEIRLTIPRFKLKTSI